MKNYSLLAGVWMLVVGCTQPKPVYDVKEEEAAIRAVLEAEQIAWNNGDLETFMQGYWNSDSLQFVSKRGINHGWKETIDAYQKAYPDRAAMGTLHFDILSVKPIGETHFLVRGKYQVTRMTGALDGVFTLIFMKVDGRWVAIYDHTC